MTARRIFFAVVRLFMHHFVHFPFSRRNFAACIEQPSTRQHQITRPIFVGEAETLLPDVHAQHTGKTDGRASRSAVAGLEGGYGVLQRSPWNNGFDVGEETITPRQLFLRRVFQFGKARLHRLSSPRYRLNRIVPETQDDGRQRDGINQCFLNNGVDILDERE